MRTKLKVIINDLILQYKNLKIKIFTNLILEKYTTEKKVKY